MKKHLFYWLALGLVVIIGCQKEVSFELGDTPAKGSLQSDVTGDCLPKTVNGVFVATSALVPATNSITISVNVASTGTYLITTDTVNGYFFRGTGTFTTLGVNTVTLRGNGTPFIEGTDNFVVSFDGTICDIAVDVLPAGSGGTAIFTLTGAPAACTGAVVSGTYIKDAPLVPTTNTVTINVNVTQLGSYTISTTYQGMTFAKTGVFTVLGANAVTLPGTGTPSTAGANTVPITVGATTCSFVVNVVVPAVYTLDGSPLNCTTPTIAGIYTVGTPLTAGNTVTLNVTVTTAGAYSVFVGPVGGMTFAGNGTLAVGAQTILLTGTGTPTTAGPNVFPITFGSSNCNFTINVTAGAGPATYTIDCPNVVVNGTYTAGVALNASNTITVPVNTTVAGTYTLTASVNGMTFSNSGSLALGASTITLNGSGTPTTATGSPFSISIGTPPCVKTITVGAAPTIDWDFMIGSTTYSGSQSDALFDNTTLPPYNVVDFYGSYNSTPDLFNITVGDAGAPVFNAGETYNSNTTTFGQNFGYFYFDKGDGTLELEATDPTTTPGVNIIFTVTSYNAATKTLIGTFAGTALDYVSGTNKTIINGHFKAIYP